MAMADAIFTLAGIVPVSDEGPSFGTPVFSSGERSTYFIQSSRREKRIDEFVRLPSQNNWINSFRELRANRSYQVGSPFLYGFVDREQRIVVEEKAVLQSRLRDDFLHYADLPYLCFSIAKFVESSMLMQGVMSSKRIESSMHNGELVRPDFLIQSESGEDPIRSMPPRDFLADKTPFTVENPLTAQLQRLKAAFED